ncbi:MAG: DEAD/DEAH box helicase [Candidatus Pacearchaeota archaeon]
MEEFLKNITPREYQQRIFETCKEKNCLVVLPTGLGKTLIALMLTIERMKKFPGEKVVFLAPTKPLAEQHITYFKKYLPELFADMQLFTGAVNAERRKKIWHTSDIIFSTPQCVANDLKNNLYDLENVCLLIEDEAHRCINNYDYNYIAQTYKKQSLHQRIVGLTASPGSDATRIKQICKNLSIEEVELRTRESPDVNQYLQELEFEKVFVDFPPKFEEMRQILKKIYDDYVEELRKRNVLFGPVNKIILIQLQKKIMASLARGNKNFSYFHAASACAQAIKIQHSMELLETQTLTSFSKYLQSLLHQASKKQSKGVVKLVNKPEFNYVFTQSNEMIIKGEEHPKLSKLIELVKKEKENTKIIIFTQFRDTATIIAKKLNEIPTIKAKVFVGQAKKISEDKKESTGLSQKEQKKIIQDFAEGKINILCATSIGEEGLDIPEVNAVIFYEPIPSAIRSIQRRGRTARLMKGKLIVLITKNTRDQTFYYASRSRERKMHSAIKEIKEEMKNSHIEEKQKSISDFNL